MSDVEGQTVRDGRFRVFSPKCGGGVVIGPGPEATDTDREAVAGPQWFESNDAALEWLGGNVP